jgi:hypothetical protein
MAVEIDDRSVTITLRDRVNEFKDAGWFSPFQQAGLRLVGWVLEHTSPFFSRQILEVYGLQYHCQDTYYTKAEEVIVRLASYRRISFLEELLRGNKLQKICFEVDIVTEDFHWVDQFKEVCSEFEESRTDTYEEGFSDVLILGRLNVGIRWHVLAVRRTTKGLYLNLYAYKEDTQPPLIWRNGVANKTSIDTKNDLAGITDSAYKGLLDNLEWHRLLETKI